MYKGESLIHCFQQWKTRVRNKRVCGVYRRKKRSAQLKHSFEYWGEWQAEEKVSRRMEGEATGKLKNLVAVMNADCRKECFDMWAAACEKKRRAMRLWKNKTIHWAFAVWFSELEEFFAIKDAVVEKCAGILQMLWGEADHKALLAWKELCVKKRKAIMRWANGALISCLGTWRTNTQDVLRVKYLMARVHLTWIQRVLRWGLAKWADIADERLFNRALMLDAVSMWSHVREIHAFRTLDEFAREQMHYRCIVDKFRRRFELRPAQMAISAWAELVAEEKWRQKQIRKFCFKFRNREVVFAFRCLQGAVQERLLQEREVLVKKSPALMRIIKRPAFLTLCWWRAGLERKQHLRSAATRVANKRHGYWRFDAFDRWACVFVDLSFQDRMQELRQAALDAVASKDLTQLLDVLHSHAAWSRTRTHSRCNLWLDTFLSTAEGFDAKAAAHRASSLRRVARVRHIQLRGARAASPDTRKLLLNDVLRLQKGLARETGGEMPLYWRAVEGLSILLKGQSSHPLAPGAMEAADAEGPEADMPLYEQDDPMIVGFTGLGELQGAALQYAATPAPTAREDDPTLQDLSWEALARVNVMHPALRAQQQIVPTYLGGRYSHLGVEKLRAQVHRTYPLKYSETWQVGRAQLNDAEVSRRYLRARRKAFASLSLQARATKAAWAACTTAQHEVIECEESTNKTRAEEASILAHVQRLEHDNPFQNNTSIRKMRQRAAQLAATADAADARGLEASHTALHWRNTHVQELAQLEVLVHQYAPLLQSREEALTLLDWQSVPLPPETTSAVSHSVELPIGTVESATSTTGTHPHDQAQGLTSATVNLPHITAARLHVQQQGEQAAQLRSEHTPLSPTAAASLPRASGWDIGGSDMAGVMSDNASRSSWAVSSIAVSSSNTHTHTHTSRSLSLSDTRRHPVDEAHAKQLSFSTQPLANSQALSSAGAEAHTTSEKDPQVNRGSRPRAQVLMDDRLAFPEAHTYARTRSCTYANTFTHVYTYIHTHTQTYTHVHTRTHTCTHTHTHTHAHTHTHTHEV